MRRAITTWAAMGLMAVLLSSQATAQEGPPPPRAQPRGPAVTVSGGSDVSVAPDRAIVRLGSVARGDAAASAQDSVNTSVQRVIDAVRHLDVADKNIATSGVTLSPIYATDGQPGRQGEPRISGFEARNTITITLDDVSRVGPVLDAAIKAGANEVQGVSFELKDQTEPRSRALRQAVQNARTKADAIAAAMGMRVTGVLEATESDVPPVRPMMLGRAMAMEATPAPIQPGQLQVHGAVTIVYSLGPGEKPMP